MDVPPEITVPDGMPALPFGKRWKKRFERAALEVGNVFNRSSRRLKLGQFKERWSLQEREFLSFRLALDEFQQRYTKSPTRNLQAISLRFLPKDIDERARIYQLHAAFDELVERHRARLGLPPRDQPSGPAPSP